MNYPRKAADFLYSVSSLCAHISIISRLGMYKYNSVYFHKLQL